MTVHIDKARSNNKSLCIDHLLTLDGILRDDVDLAARDTDVEN